MTVDRLNETKAIYYKWEIRFFSGSNGHNFVYVRKWDWLKAYIAENSQIGRIPSHP